MDVSESIESIDEIVVDEDALESGRLRDESIAIVRGLILKANPDVVVDLVQGATLTELMDSVEPARAAYQRIAETVRSVAPVVPAGGTGGALAIETLTADSLIKRGLEQARRQ